MKIFGKRKSKPASEGIDKKTDEAPTTADLTPGSEENVASYFSSTTDDGTSKKKRKKNPANEINGDEMETLLKMDYEQLNSKQRRLVRRHRERSGEDTGADDAAASDTADAASKTKDASDVAQEDAAKSERKPDKISESKTATENDDAPALMNHHEKELLTKLEGLNSKDRRKFLRQLKTDNPNNVDIDKLEQEAKHIAERNIRDSQEQDKTPKKEQPKQQQPSVETTKSTSKKKRKKDLSHLPPEEIIRREKQRQLQIEAAERRARGEDLNNGHRHPLNSERRRANRRKPARKSQGVKGGAKREFNSVGYQMRKNA